MRPKYGCQSCRRRQPVCTPGPSTRAALLRAAPATHDPRRVPSRQRAHLPQAASHIREDLLIAERFKRLDVLHRCKQWRGGGVGYITA